MSGVFMSRLQIPVTLFKREIHNKAVLTLETLHRNVIADSLSHRRIFAGLEAQKLEGQTLGTLL